MSTLKAIIAEYGTSEIPLEQICDRYLGCGPKLAKERAASASLPVPAYKTARNAPWHVRAADLAALIDAEAATARERWAMVRGAA